MKNVKNSGFKQLILGVAIAAACYSSPAFADVSMPAEATAPTAPQERPEASDSSRAVVLEVDTIIAETEKQDKQGETISEKTRNEIRAMLADVVRSAKNVVVIEQDLVTPDSKPAADSSNLIVGDQPNGEFRLSAKISGHLIADDKAHAILTLQLLHAGHSGDKQDMNKPIKEETFKIDPDNVRQSEKDIVTFLKSELHFGNNEAQAAMKRPLMDMWIEVKSPDGSVGVSNGVVPKDSTMVIYYKPNKNVYMNLYIVGDSGKIDRFVPSHLLKNNFSKANHIYRFPPTGDGLPVNGEGENKIRAIFTLMPSGLGRDMGLKNGLQARQDPIAVIPTQYPAIFATKNLEHFFSLPDVNWNEKEISFEIK